MNKLKFNFIVVILIHSIGYTQPGFLGSKNLLTLNAYVNPTILSGSFFDKSIQLSNSELVEQLNLYDYGFEMNYIRNYKNNISIGFASGALRYQIPVTKEYYENRFKSDTYYNVDSIQTRSENLQFNQFSLIPTIYFHTKDGMGPTGIFYSIGFGMSMSTLANLNYGYQINQIPTNYSGSNEVWSPVDFYQNNQKWSSIYAASLRFGFGFNHSITERILWNVSFNYTLNYNFKPSEESFNSQHNDFFNLEDSFYSIQRKNFLIFSIGTGIAFLF
jgi:hypothetical protein